MGVRSLKYTLADNLMDKENNKLTINTNIYANYPKILYMNKVKEGKHKTFHTFFRSLTKESSLMWLKGRVIL